MKPMLETSVVLRAAALLIVSSFALAACGSVATGVTVPASTTLDRPGVTANTEPTTTPTPAPASTATATATPSPAAETTAEPIATATPEPKLTPTPTAHPTVAPTPEPEPQATPTPTARPAATPTAVLEPTATPTAAPTATPTPEPEPTPTAQTTAGNDLIARGERIFQETAGGVGCQLCHGQDATGLVGPNIQGASAIMIIGALDRASNMAFIELQPGELEALVAYLQTLGGT